MIAIDLSNQQALDVDPRAFNILERLEIQNVQERQLCSLSQRDRNYFRFFTRNCKIFVNILL